ncbi:MAG TPA: hypothetical protein VKP30_10005, partial [Polyangiaceae bacterium]|nr:hypothetical protein [Polyangiaceae bacterium]
AGSSLSAEPAVAPDGTIYVASRQGTLDVLEPTGVHRFTITLGGTPAGKFYVDQRGWAYVGMITGKLIAVTPQGQKYFTYDSAAGIASGLEYAENLGLLFLGRHQTVEAVNRAGYLTTRVRYEHALAAPPIGLDGWYVVATAQNELTWSDRFGRRIKRPFDAALRSYGATADGGVWALSNELTAFSKKRDVVFRRPNVLAMSPSPKNVMTSRGVTGVVVTAEHKLEWLDAQGSCTAATNVGATNVGATSVGATSVGATSVGATGNAGAPSLEETIQLQLDDEATAWVTTNGAQLRLVQSNGEIGRAYEFERESLLPFVFDSPRRRTVLATRDGAVYQVNWPSTP